MGIKDFLNKVKQGVVINEVEKMSLPEFQETNICRKQILFEGLVQQVGFRFEMQMIAVKLGLTGQAINQSDGSVLTEVQGTEEKIGADRTSDKPERWKCFDRGAGDGGKN